jgi:hypothetical protein
MHATAVLLLNTDYMYATSVTSEYRLHACYHSVTSEYNATTALLLNTGYMHTTTVLLLNRLNACYYSVTSE